MKGKLLTVLALSSLLLALVAGFPHQVSARGGSTPTPTATPPPAGPPAPTPTSPANGAQVTVPFTLAWSGVSDPSGIVAYNWQISPSSSFATVAQQNSTNGQTQDTAFGLANGTYFWRVQAVNGNFQQGAWSAAQSFAVTGANAGEPSAPALDPPKGGTAFHPMEVISFTWSAVDGAASYTLDASTDPSFSIPTLVHSTNIPNPASSLDLGDSMPQGTWYVRVAAVNAQGIASVPSNVVTFTLSFDAPLPPPPTLLGPANGASVTLPVTLTWTDVPNPQPSGYVLEVADDSSFGNIEYVNNQITGPHWTITSLTAGTKFWHVLSTQGDSAPDTPANTAWSATGTFTVPAAPPQVGSLALTSASPFSGDTETVSIQLTGPAPAGGAVVSLTSSDPNAAPVPATHTIAAGFAFDQFRFPIGQVTAPTPVTLTATLNGGSASASLTVQPPSLKSISVSSPITGGGVGQVTVLLNGLAPAGGLSVGLASSNPAVASVPATATVAAGSASAIVGVQTSAVTTSTVVTISASLSGTTVSTDATVTPQQPLAAVSVSPTSVVGTAGANGTVTLAAAASTDTQVFLTSSNPAVVSVPSSATVPQGVLSGGFFIGTNPATTATTVTITASSGGVTKTATLTVQPFATPTPTPTPGAGATLASLALSPTSLKGGDSATGTVALSAPAPAGGTVVALSSGNTSLATVPSSVTVAAGASGATFTVQTKSVNTTSSVTITASAGGTSQSASLTLTH